MIDKMNPSAAAGAYANIQKAVTGGSGDTGTSSSGDATGGAGSFDDIMSGLKTKIQDAIDTVHKGEKASAAAVTGKAELPDVIAAINDASFTVDTVTAVRDRVIDAYNKIQQMSM